MAKKRRDKERDPSSSQRLLKAGKTALAVGAGAVFLRNTDMGKKFTREIAPALKQTRDNVKKDLIGKNKKNLLVLDDTYEKHLTSKAFKKVMLDKKNEKTNIDMLDSKLYRNLLGLRQKIEGSDAKGLGKSLKANHDNKIKEEALERIINEYILPNKDYEHITETHIKQIIDSTYDTISKVTTKSDLPQQKLSKTLNETLQISKKDQENIFETLLDTIQSHSKREGTAYVKKNMALGQDIKNIHDSNLDYYNRKYDKVDSFFKNFLGININSDKLLNASEAVTVGDFLKDYDTIKDQISLRTGKYNAQKINADDKSIKLFNFLDELKELVDKNEDANKLVISNSFRKTVDENGDNVYFNTQDNVDFLNSVHEKLKDTLPYKVLFKPFNLGQENPNVFISQTDKKSALMKHKKLTGREDDATLKRIAENKNTSLAIFINGKTYFTDEKNGVLTLDQNSGIDTKLVRGFEKKELYNIIGESDFAIPEKYNSHFAKLLDINQRGEFNHLNIFKRIFHKFDDPNWEFNSITNVENAYINGLSPKSYIEMTLSIENLKGDLTDSDAYEKRYIELLSRLHIDETVTSRKLNENTTGVTDELLNSLINNEYVSDRHKKLLGNLLDGDIASFLDTVYETNSNHKGISDFDNDNLNVLVNKWFNSTQEMIGAGKDIRSKNFRVPLLEMPSDQSTQLNQLGQLRIETAKDILLSLGDGVENDKLFQWIDDLGLSKKDSYSFKDLAISAMFDKYTGISSIQNHSEELSFMNINNMEFSDVLMSNPMLKSHFEANLGSIKSEFGPLSKGSTYNLNELFYSEQESYGIVKKSSIGQILTTDLNNNIKFNSQALIDTTKELVANRNNLENVTELTLLTQSLMTRWNYGVQELGLGLSSDSLSGPLDTFKNISLKRVLPVMIAGTSLDLLNYESQKITGVSLVGAGANALAKTDMNIRHLLDSTGASSALNYFAESSVIAEYYTGERKFKTAEEEQEWYQNGYSPVRKGRFWSFGSSSEFRGGNITYYQPNYLKRAHSDYYNESVYGGSDEKWAHSWIPTPQHPLSTFRAFLDPYWLERKHLKENDRPYPLTGKMFSEGSFWGSILNPTIGQAIKPVTMLPEARRRLGRNGVDAQATIEKLNTKIKQKGNRNDDLLIVEGSDIRNAEYVPYGNPENNELNVTFQNGRANVRGINFMNSVDNISNYEAPDGMTFTEEIKNPNGSVMRKQRKVLNKSEIFFRQMQNSQGNVDQGPSMALNLISSLNNKIKNTGQTRQVNDVSYGPNKQEGTFIYRNLVNERNNYLEDYYASKDTKKMVDKSILNDYRRDLLYSQKQLHGIYGFLADQFFGSQTYTYRYENAGNMNSFSRKFWNQNLGGLGGGFMEIARRFFPSQDRSRVNINPLRNNMPEWIPDSYHFGDPYTEIPKGEMRLPGKGYESLNQLHSDSFGTYGAFDRYKILADVAPNSSEFKKWKSIAQNTIEDPKLKKQMEDIGVRVAKMSGNHEFYNYNYIKTNTEYRKGVIKGFSQGQVVLIDNTKLTLAGIKPNEYADKNLSRLLSPGQEINYKTYKDVSLDYNGQAKTEAVVYTQGKSPDNINQELIKLGGAEKDKEDFSPLAITGKQSGSQEVMGAIQEVVAHARIPILHNKFMKIETPLESYMAENYYGSNFKTWDHPIKGFIIPAFNEQSGKSLLSQAFSVGFAYLHFDKIAGSTDKKLLRYASNVALTTLNPSAFIGGAIGYGSRLSFGNMTSDGGSPLTDFQKGAKIGTIIGTAKWGWDNADNPILAATSFALAGATAISTRENVAEVVKKRFGKTISKSGIKEGALIGAAIGIGVSAIKNSDFDKERMFGKWAPKDTKKKWELDEYFDRLNYIKYKGLYQAASIRASIFENSNIRQIFKDIDKNKKDLAKINRKTMEIIQSRNATNYKNQSKLNELNLEKNTLIEQNKMYLQGGKYTKAAVAYKKKMESTIYGLDETATKDELLASVPDQYKDHFKAFMETTNKKEQEKILKYVPEYLQRPLQVAWGQKPNSVKSNRTYFKNHKMPSMAWKGWKPNVNMKHVKMKTIQNEGMLLSDFGYYDSEKSKPTYAVAPSIRNYDNRSSQFFRTNLMANLNGLGVSVSNVSVEPTSAPGIWVVSDIKDTALDYKKVAGYKMNSFAQTVSDSIF